MSEQEKTNQTNSNEIIPTTNPSPIVCRPEVQPLAIPLGAAVAPPRLPPITIDRTLGVVETLSESERAELFSCQEVLDMGWHTFVEVGLALARIRDGRLYREDYVNFEAYCRAKWEYGRRYIDDLIGAAQLFTDLRTNCSERQPDHESQVRPLIGLEAEQARLAWQHAAKKAGSRRITARLVQNAVRELKVRASGAPPVNRPRRMKKQDQGRLFEDRIVELLGLVRGNASPQVLIEKLEGLHTQVHCFFMAASTRP